MTLVSELESYHWQWTCLRFSQISWLQIIIHKLYTFIEFDSEIPKKKIFAVNIGKPYKIAVLSPNTYILWWSVRFLCIFEQYIYEIKYQDKYFVFPIDLIINFGIFYDRDVLGCRRPSMLLSKLWEQIRTGPAHQLFHFSQKTRNVATVGK